MSKAKDTLKAITETGEPDQDYDQDFYNAVCKKLKKAGFDCSHREFDKYQGVYIKIPGLTTLWTADSFVTGKRVGSGSTFSFEKGSETNHYVLQSEGDRVIMTVTDKNGNVDVSEVTKYLKSLQKKKGK
jgi:hypothetical protein